MKPPENLCIVKQHCDDKLRLADKFEATSEVLIDGEVIVISNDKLTFVNELRKN